MTAGERLISARTQLLLGNRWFGALAMHLRMEADASIGTIATDGSRLVYNPDFVNAVPKKLLESIWAHEVLHCVLKHPVRLKSRDRLRFNLAGDFAVNQILRDEGFSLGFDWYQDDRYRGMTAEQIYSKLRDDEQKQQEKLSDQEGQGGSWQSGDKEAAGPGGQQKGKPSGKEVRAPSPPLTSMPGRGSEQCSSGVVVPPSSAKKTHVAMTEADWEVAAEQATCTARKASCCPGNAAAAAATVREKELPWPAVLREYLQRASPSNYSWVRPSRRLSEMETYMPSLVREGIGTVVVVADTSGSISQECFEYFGGEISAILREAQPQRTILVYCDARVQGTAEFQAGEELTLERMGRGGTAFRPAFDWVAEEGLDPAVLVYLTDLESCDQPEEPPYPVLWAVPEWVTREAPFGRLLRLRY